MDELNQKLEQLKQRTTISAFALIGLIVVALIIFKKFGAYGFIPIALAVLCGIYAAKAQREYKGFYKTTVVPSAIRRCTFLDDINYDSNAGVDINEVAGSGICARGDNYRSSDLVTAVVCGTEFKLSNVEITEVHYSGSDNDRSESTIFRGQWVIFDLKKLYCEPEAELEKLNQKLGKKIDFKLISQRAHLAIHNNDPFMEGKLGTGKIDALEDEKRIVDTIRAISEFVEEVSGQKA